MSEAAARAWIGDRYGGVAVDRLAQFADLVEAESAKQNLVARSTLPMLWERHILDSAQLVPLASDVSGDWIDIGTGAGFPGMVVAILAPERTVHLVEPRKRRAAFLESVLRALGLDDRVRVVAAKVEAVRLQAGVVSARAVAQLDAILAAASHCASPDTMWILPKGRNAAEEVAIARREWHGMFHVEQSLTDPESAIIIARGVKRRCT